MKILKEHKDRKGIPFEKKNFIAQRSFLSREKSFNFQWIPRYCKVCGVERVECIARDQGRDKLKSF